MPLFQHSDSPSIPLYPQVLEQSKLNTHTRGALSHLESQVESSGRLSGESSHVWLSKNADKTTFCLERKNSFVQALNSYRTQTSATFNCEIAAVGAGKGNRANFEVHRQVVLKTLSHFVNEFSQSGNDLACEGFLFLFQP